MKTIAFLLLANTLAFSQSEPTKEPLKFRGAFIGEPLSDFADCPGGKAKSLKDGYKTHGKLCEGRGSVGRVKVHTRVFSGNGSAEDCNLAIAHRPFSCQHRDLDFPRR